MAKWIRRIVMLLLAAVFIVSIAYIGIVYFQYGANDKRNGELAERFTMEAEAAPAQEDGGEALELAPIIVDFAGLKAENEDIIGWLYCEDTPIDYPVLQGVDNDQYLRHTYDGAYNTAGSIFVEAENSRNFADANTIVYGHHMKNGSMFAVLDKWAEPGFYEEHPVMWLLTPEQDYRVDLYSTYTTSAYSDTYTIFPEPCAEFDAYLENCMAQSVFTPAVRPDGSGHHVVFSTCAYVFDNARSVVHGVLVPADSAGGMPLK